MKKNLKKLSLPTLHEHHFIKNAGIRASVFHAGRNRAFSQPLPHSLSFTIRVLLCWRIAVNETRN